MGFDGTTVLVTADTTGVGFDAMIDVNLRAPFFLTAALTPQMAKRGATVQHQ